jgi:hypothetical protein
MFVVWSVHENPFPEAITPLSRLGRYLFASVLFIVELAFLVGPWATTGFLAWFTRNQLWKPVDNLGLREEAEEVLGYLIFDTIFLILLIWGVVPVFAVNRMSGNRGRVFIYATFGGIMAVFIGVSARTMYLTWKWALLFEAGASDARLAGRCYLIACTLGVLLCSICVFIILYLCYRARYGTPLFVRQMLDDAAHIMCRSEMRSKTVTRKDSEESMRKSADA